MTITQIKITDLRPHPKNPRLIFREDVIAGNVAGLGNGFKAKYAITVRPVAVGFEIISGVHRVKAALAVGLESVPCWVEEMDDETAYMALVLCNTASARSSFEKTNAASLLNETMEYNNGN